MEEKETLQSATGDLIAANLLYFLIVTIAGPTEESSVLVQWGALYTPYIEDGAYWRLASAMFLHSGIRHLMNNMITLFVLGTMLEEELGLAPREKEAGQKAYVYFALTQPTFDLEDNDRGTLTIVLDSRHDVLRVPSSAISTINGETVVYYQNDEGMKAYKNVTVGLEANDLIEIIAGLEEGDLVIAK